MRIDKFLIATFYPRPSSARYINYYIIALSKKLIFGCRTQSKYIQFSYFSRELWENREGFIYLPQKRGTMKHKIEQSNEREAPVEYQKMYYTLMAAISEAMELLARAQQQCEEWYVNANTEGQPPTR